MAMRDTPFEHALIEDIIPFIDANFRTIPDQPHRALAGLSMGGMLTHGISLAHLDKFSHIGDIAARQLGRGEGGPDPAVARIQRDGAVQRFGDRDEVIADITPRPLPSRPPDLRVPPKPVALPGDEPEPLIVETHAIEELPALLLREDFHEARAIAALYIARDRLREEQRSNSIDLL